MAQSPGQGKRRSTCLKIDPLPPADALITGTAPIGTPTPRLGSGPDEDHIGQSTVEDPVPPRAWATARPSSCRTTRVGGGFDGIAIQIGLASHVVSGAEPPMGTPARAAADERALLLTRGSEIGSGPSSAQQDAPPSFDVLSNTDQPAAEQVAA